MSEPIKIESYSQPEVKMIVNYLFARAREAEARVAELETLLVREEKANAAWKWGREVGDFLKVVLTKMICREEMQEASRLITDAIALGIILEPDCEPGKTWEIKPGDDPGQIILRFCPKCGGRKI